MKKHCLTIAALPLLCGPAAAQSTPATGAAQPAPAAPAQEQLSQADIHVRTGITLLAQLHDVLAKIQDKDTAEEAVPPLMRLEEALTRWSKSTAAMPPLSDLERMEMEDKYLPVIKRLNARIKSQAERVAAAEFYGSRNLPAALVHIVTNCSM